MTIRAKLTLRFTIIVSAITIAISLIIYTFSSNHRQEEFDERLYNEAQHTLNLYFLVEEVDSSLLRKINEADSTMVGDFLTIHGPGNEILFNTNSSTAPDLHKRYLEKSGKSLTTEPLQGSENNRDYVMFTYNHKGRLNKVVISAVDFWGLEQLRFLRLILLTSCCAAMLLAAPLGYLYSGRMLQPINRMVNEVNEINALSAGTRRGKRLSTGKERDELERLAITLNRMLLRLEQSLDAQRNFVASASHELRSPLTALAGQIEVALRQPRANEEYRNLLESLTDDLNRLTDLTNGLLTLAKTDAIVDMPSINYRIDELVDDAIVETLRRDKNWSIDVDYEDFPEDDELFNATGNNNLLRIALVNILDNACKYSPNHKAELRVGLTQENIVLQCIDHGIGIPESETEKVFGRFFRASNTGGIRGHGLGLPLARRITELHGGDLQLVSQQDKGTVVTMTILRKIPRRV
ncbi:MAG: HAMP domain-containing histidine kinase [Bacteroidia bacterium]|jgi:signal transduction histidine kinase|nr:HAMP domain-containing histidine kinase [Bacteroidia bacterium]